MPVITIVIGSALTILGIAGYVLTGSEHPTALIPLGFGTLFELCGALALSPKLRKHAMHAAAALALIGVLGTIDGVIGGIKWVSGTPPVGPKYAAVISKLIMFGLCLLFEILCVNSFIQARRARQANPEFPANPTS